MGSIDSTSSEMLVFEEIGVKYYPDIIICYFMDDFPDNVRQIHGRTYAPFHKLGNDGELIFIPPEPRDLSTFWEEFKKESLLYRLLANKLLESKFYHDIRSINSNIKFFINGIFLVDKTDVKPPIDERKKILIEEGWPLTLALIDNFNIAAELNASEFILVDGIEFNDVNVGTKYTNMDLANYCEEKGITYIPNYKLYADMRTPENSEKYFFNDGHPKSIGYKRLSISLGEKIKGYLALESYI
jgi:hypothetical protein